MSDPHVYSIQDFSQVKTGILPLELSKLVQECCKHVAECVVSSIIFNNIVDSSFYEGIALIFLKE